VKVSSVLATVITNIIKISMSLNTKKELDCYLFFCGLFADKNWNPSLC